MRSCNGKSHLDEFTVKSTVVPPIHLDANCMTCVLLCLAGISEWGELIFSSEGVRLQLLLKSGYGAICCSLTKNCFPIHLVIYLIIVKAFAKTCLLYILQGFRLFQSFLSSCEIVIISRTISR